MKNSFCALLFCILVISVTAESYSQEFQSAKERNKNKPTLFDKYADSIDVHPNFFNATSSLKLNDEVILQAAQQLIFKGKVNILHETADYRTVSIESEETPGLRLILSHTSEDKYYGLLGCIKHRDVLTLRLNETTKKYEWIKKEIAEIIPD